MGVVYLWLMLDIIGNITTNVAKGLKEQIKLFGQKGLQEMYPTGESVEHMVLDYTSICNMVDQQKMLPNDSICDIIQGLPLSSHVKFAKIVAEYVFDLKNPLMQSVMLAGSSLKQVSIVLETPLSEYPLYSLSIGDDA